MYNPQRHHRRSQRLQSYDYSQSGFYYVTVCTEMRIHLFGEIVESDANYVQSNKNAQVNLNPFGQIVLETWLDLVNHNSNVHLHQFVLMPNHAHGIIEITDDARHGLTEIIRQFKTFSSRKINTIRDSQGEKVWQRGFHEHVVRNAHDLQRISEYIRNNPKRWFEEQLSRRDGF